MAVSTVVGGSPAALNCARFSRKREFARMLALRKALTALSTTVFSSTSTGDSSTGSDVLFLSGDKHWAEKSRMDGGVGYLFYEVTSSSLNRPRAYIFENNRHRIGRLARLFAGAVYYEANFGMLTRDWDRSDPLIGLEIRSDRGEIILRHEIPLSDLRPRETNARGSGGGTGK